MAEEGKDPRSRTELRGRRTRNPGCASAAWDRVCRGCRRVRALRLPAGPPLRIQPKGLLIGRSSGLIGGFGNLIRTSATGLPRAREAPIRRGKRARRAVSGARRFEVWLGFAGSGGRHPPAGHRRQLMARRIGLQGWAACGSVAGRRGQSRRSGAARSGGRQRRERARRRVAGSGRRSDRQGESVAPAGGTRRRARRGDERTLGTRTLLFALATGYVVLLAVETWWLLGRLRGGEELSLQA